jgi:hypothetical protein
MPSAKQASIQVTESKPIAIIFTAIGGGIFGYGVIHLQAAHIVDSAFSVQQASE